MVGSLIELGFLKGHDKHAPLVRVKVRINLGQPLLVRMFLEEEHENVVFVRSRYEDLFRIWTECGNVGHETSRCNTQPFLAENEIKNRIEEFGQIVFILLRGRKELFLQLKII